MSTRTLATGSRWLSLLAGLWFVPPSTTAAGAAPPAPAPAPALTLEQFVTDVRLANPSVAAARAALNATEQRRAAATTLPDPQLRYAIAPQSVGVAGLDTGHILGISQPFPWPGKLSAQGAVADANRDAARATLRDETLMVVALARQTYAEWQFQSAALAANDAQHARLQELAETARGLYRTGAGSQAAVLNAQTRIAELERQALAIRARQTTLAAQMNALRQQPPSARLVADRVADRVATPTALTGRRPTAPHPRGLPDLPEASVLQTLLDTHHPQLAQQRALQDIAASRAALAQLDERPDVRLDVNYLGTLPREENRLQVGVALNLPFGYGGRQKRRANIAAADADQHAARMRAVAMRDQLSATLAAAVADDASAAARAALLVGTILPLARDTVTAHVADYASGAGSITAVLNAETKLLEAHLNLARARADRLIARSVVDRLTGGAMTASLFHNAAGDAPDQPTTQFPGVHP